MATVDEQRLKEARMAFLEQASQKAPALRITITVPLNAQNLANLSNEQLIALYDEIAIILSERGVKF